MQPYFLVVDNEEMVRFVLPYAIMHILPTAIVVGCATVTEALHALTETTFDCVITDYSLHSEDDKDGLEVVDAAHALAPPPVTIIMLGIVTLQHQEEFAKRNNIHIIQKPIHLDDLRSILTSQPFVKYGDSEQEVTCD